MFRPIRQGSALPRLMRMFLFSAALIAILYGFAAAAIYPQGDLTGDCKVDWEDILTFAEQWLDVGSCSHFGCADFDSLNGINFTDFAFLANNWQQRGVQDLGNIGAVALEDVNIPDAGYTRFGVDAINNHTYVSLAHGGEEGNHIVFRVHSAAADNSEVTIEYCYRFLQLFWVEHIFDLKRFMYEAARAELVFEKLKLIGKGDDILGLVDVTDKKEIKLDEIKIPSRELSREVPAKEGHLYLIVTKKRA